MNTVQSAEQFLRDCIRGGLAHSYDVFTSRWVKPYPEATGYLLSYFAAKEKQANVPQFILKAADKLINIQHPSGGFRSFADHSTLFTFDTAQIMNGLICLFKTTGKGLYLERAVRCGEFVCDMQLPDGSMFPMYKLPVSARYADKTSWGTSLSHIQVKNIEGLLLLFEVTGETKYKIAAENLAVFGKANCAVHFTHPAAYCMEGLLCIGEIGFVAEQLRRKVVPLIRDNGFIAYAPELPYAYVSGSVQMGILFFKAGFKEESKIILDWARRVQAHHTCGGLFQYATPDGDLCSHVHSEINSWGTKYFCELERLWQSGS